MYVVGMADAINFIVQQSRENYFINFTTYILNLTYVVGKLRH